MNGRCSVVVGPRAVGVQKTRVRVNETVFRCSTYTEGLGINISRHVHVILWTWDLFVGA